MEFKITKYSSKYKEELPPINKPTRPASQNYKELKEPADLLLNKIDPLILVAQYEREINRMQINHKQMMEELHKELEILRSRNRDLLDELILMNGGTYCHTHLENLSYEILNSNASDKQKQLSDVLYNARIQPLSSEDSEYNKNYNYKKELPELLTIRTNFISKDIENKSNLVLQDQLYKSNKLIDILQQENIQQKSELNSLLKNGLNISGIGLENNLLKRNLQSSKKNVSSISHPAISYRDIINE